MMVFAIGVYSLNGSMPDAIVGGWVKIAGLAASIIFFAQGVRFAIVRGCVWDFWTCSLPPGREVWLGVCLVLWSEVGRED